MFTPPRAPDQQGAVPPARIPSRAGSRVARRQLYRFTLVVFLQLQERSNVGLSIWQNGANFPHLFRSRSTGYKLICSVRLHLPPVRAILIERCERIAPGYRCLPLDFVETRIPDRFQFKPARRRNFRQWRPGRRYVRSLAARIAPWASRSNSGVFP